MIMIPRKEIEKIKIIPKPRHEQVEVTPFQLKCDSCMVQNKTAAKVCDPCETSRVVNEKKSFRVVEKEVIGSDPLFGSDNSGGLTFSVADTALLMKSKFQSGQEK